MSNLLKDSEHKINDDAFSLTELHKLFNNRGFDENGKLRDFVEAKKYVLRYFYRSESGYMINQNGKIECKSEDIVARTYFKRFPRSLIGEEKDVFIKWFNCSPSITIYRPVCIPNRQLILGDTINTIAKQLHNKDMKFDDCPKKDKDSAITMLNFIKEVWASNNEDQYEYLINWFAGVIQGKKNQTLLYVKTVTEGIGKSTVTDFLRFHVLGTNLCEQSPSTPLLTGNNSLLYGKMLVVFEELKKASKNEWEMISSCLKEWITSDVIQFNQKYLVPFTSNNINNYIVNCNSESIRGADGRRYFLCDLSTKYKGDTDFWKNLHDTCFNNGTGKAFYMYMMERDIRSFNSARMPETKRKNDCMADLLKSPFKFIKYNFVLTNKDLKCTVKELYEYYTTYCEKTEQKQTFQRPFVALLREIGIEYKTSNSKTFYNINIKELQKLSVKYNWLSPDDQDELEDNVIWKGYTLVKDLAVSNNNNLFQVKDYEDEIEKLKQRLLALEQENAELKRTKQKPELTEQHSEFSSNVPATPKKEKKEKKPKKEKKEKKPKKEKKEIKPKKEKPTKDKSKSKKEKPKKDKSKSKVDHIQLFLNIPDIDDMFNN